MIALCFFIVMVALILGRQEAAEILAWVAFKIRGSK
jgi:hypothetical protein